MSNFFYNVEPRYTPGSPGAVDFRTAKAVAADEQQCYTFALDGVYGDADQRKAKESGLDLIVFSMYERPKGWHVEDLITGKRYFWPFKAKCPKCGKQQTCKRGKIDAHRLAAGRWDVECEGAGAFVGKEVVE